MAKACTVLNYSILTVHYSPFTVARERRYLGWIKGLEPSTLGTTIRCSNQLSYTHHIKSRILQPKNCNIRRWALQYFFHPNTAQYRQNSKFCGFRYDICWHNNTIVWYTIRADGRNESSLRCRFAPARRAKPRNMVYCQNSTPLLAATPSS